MRRRWSTWLCIAIVLSCGALLDSCGGGSLPPPPVRQLISVNVQPSTISAVQGATSSFTATGTFDQAPTTEANLAAQWASSDTNVATINASTGVATCIGVGGPVTITASKAGKGGTVQGTATLTCSQPPLPLTITSGNPTGGVAGVAYGQLHTVPTPRGPLTVRYFRLTASGGSGTYSWTWAAAQGATLPAGLTCCNPVFGQPAFPFGRGVVVRGAIAGRPTAVGDFHVIVTVTDSSTPPQQVSNDYVIHIAPPPPPVINSTPGPAIGTLNSPYDGFTFTATGGFGALTWSKTGALPPGMALNASGVLAGTPTSAGSFPVTLTAQDSAGQSSAPQDFTIQVLPQGFVPTASMTSARMAHTATLLGDGRVLLVGGADSNGELKTAELFDPSAKTFSATGSMTTARQAHTATKLANGKVLVAGGFLGGNPLSSAEVFDPGTGTFSVTGNMNSVHVFQTATLLNNGKVLLTGGLDATGIPSALAEVFDPATSTFTSVQSMAFARTYHTATLLANGKVLIAGGMDATQNPIATAELFDPTTQTFSSTTTLATPRLQHSATMLTNGKILLVGGFVTGGATATSELFDPGNNTFGPAGTLQIARNSHDATLLANGQVLITGGLDGNSAGLSAAEIGQATGDSFDQTADMTVVRSSHTATLLNNGQVLVTGGMDRNGNPLDTAELYH